MVKDWPAMQETWTESLDQEDPMEKGMDGEPGGLPSMGSHRVGHD